MKSLTGPIPFGGGIATYCPKRKESQLMSAKKDRLLMLYAEFRLDIRTYSIPGPEIELIVSGRRKLHTSTATLIHQNGLEEIVDLVADGQTFSDVAQQIESVVIQQGGRYKVIGEDYFDNRETLYKNYQELIRYLHPHTATDEPIAESKIIARLNENHRQSLSELIESTNLAIEKILTAISSLLHAGLIAADIDTNLLSQDTCVWLSKKDTKNGR